MRRQAWAALFALLALLAVPLSALAAYPPGTFPGAAPGGTYRTIVMSQQVCADGGSMQASYGQSTLTLQVPNGAFSTCTQVSIYVAEPGVISPLLPAGANLVDGFAVGWDPIGTAAGRLSLTIKDAAITSDAQVFATTTSGVQPFADAKVQAGDVTLGLTTPLGFVVAATGAANPSPSGEVLGATSPPTLTAPPTNTGSGEGRPPTDNSGPSLALLLLVGLAAVIVARRYRRTGNPR